MEDSVVITGKVVDENNEPVMNAIVQAKEGIIIKGATVTDFDGNFILKTASDSIRKLSIHTYYVTYKEHVITNIPFTDKLIELPITKLTLRHFEPFEITTQCPPMFDIYGSGNTKTITSYELEQMGH